MLFELDGEKIINDENLKFLKEVKKYKFLKENKYRLVKETNNFNKTIEFIIERKFDILFYVFWLKKKSLKYSNLDEALFMLGVLNGKQQKVKRKIIIPE